MPPPLSDPPPRTVPVVDHAAPVCNWTPKAVVFRSEQAAECELALVDDASFEGATADGLSIELLRRTENKVTLRLTPHLDANGISPKLIANVGYRGEVHQSILPVLVVSTGESCNVSSD